MNRKALIIVTRCYNEAKTLHKHVDGDDRWSHNFEKEMFPWDIKSLDQNWYWTFDDNGSLSGSGGTGALEAAQRISGVTNFITVDEFVMHESTWKIENDPYMAGIYKKHGIDGVKESGYFIDSTTAPEDIDYMLGVPTTPVSVAVANMKTAKNPVVLLSAGSFCPPHQGHIDMMEAAKSAVSKDYDVIAGYLSPGHDEYIAHKTGDKSIPIHKRIAMCEKMCPSWISVDPWEGIFNKHAIMFTHVVERLEQYLEKHLGRKVPVFFVCGMDNEKYVLSFRNKGGCVIVGRPGYVSKLWGGAKPHESRIYYTECNNPLSSTEVRKTSSVTLNKTNLHLRVEDTMFEAIGADHNKLLNIVSEYYNKVTVSLLSKQMSEFENIKKAGEILSLDPFMHGHANLRISRHYDLFGSKMLRFSNAPEAGPLGLQLAALAGREYFLFDDDIHTTGGTIRYVSGLLDKQSINVRGAMTFKVSDDSQGEILDLRDFFVHQNCGLVVTGDNEEGFRVPYMYPYVCPFARASVIDPMNFSIRMWEYNRDFHKNSGMKVRELGSMGLVFVWSGLATPDMPVWEACENHINLLKKFI